MSHSPHLINAIFEVVTPGREFTREDIWNRLQQRNERANPRLRLIPEEVARAVHTMTRRRMLKSEEIHTSNSTTSAYRRADNDSTGF